LNKPIALILTSGSALSINYAKQNIPTIIESWYAGEQGGNAIADILFGDYNPAGRLPITFYKSIEQLPDFEDYNMKNRTYRYFKEKPLFPFGFGLSYTQFEYNNLRITPNLTNSNQSVQISVDVKNIGDIGGDEVIQLYISHPSVKICVPMRELKGFERIYLKDGEVKTISFKISPTQYSIVNENGENIIERGKILIFAGGCQPGFEEDKNGIFGSFEVI
jgi:beta-glucosidase